MTDSQKPVWGQTYRCALHAAVLVQFVWLGLPLIVLPWARSGAELPTGLLLALWFERWCREVGWMFVLLFLLLHLFVEMRGWIRPESRRWLVPQTGLAVLTGLLLLVTALPTRFLLDQQR